MVISTMVQASVMVVWYKPLIYRGGKRRPERPRTHQESPSKALSDLEGVGLGSISFPTATAVCPEPGPIVVTWVGSGWGVARWRWVC